jgi:hypothetical protein
MGDHFLTQIRLEELDVENGIPLRVHRGLPNKNGSSRLGVNVQIDELRCAGLPHHLAQAERVYLNGLRFNLMTVDRSRKNSGSSQAPDLLAEHLALLGLQLDAISQWRSPVQRI